MACPAGRLKYWESHAAGGVPGVLDGGEGLLDKVERLLRDVPLCDRCLGRMFARLGYGMSNKERGRALKIALLMEIHRRILEGRPGARELLEELAPRIGEAAAPLYERLTGRPLEPVECAICGGGLDRFIEEAARLGERLLRAYDIERFVVGVRASRSVIEREERIKQRHGLEYAESIKAEIRREVGKILRDRGFTVDFDEPEATLMVEYPGGAVWLQVNSLLLRGRYWKKGRLISQAYWPTPQGPKYYSVEQALWGLLQVTGGERVVLHAAGREDVDARMLGTGRPMIVEVKAPRRRHIPLEKLEEAANQNRDLVEVELEGPARRSDIALYKEESPARRSKAYKALVLSEEPVEPSDLRRIEEELRERVVLQRTPTRVLHRRPDILRRRRVHRVECRQYTSHVFECLVVAEGGLYIKELVSGDEGRTSPSFSSITGKTMRCIELDVIAVSGALPRGHA